jgi:nitrite reductase (NADH) small subunit
MSDWTRIAAKSELPAEGEAREFETGDKVVCVANVNGTCSAMDNACLHHGGPLGQGVVLDGKVVCPWHGWGYDPVTGAADRGPGAKVAVYPIKVEGDDVLVQM